MEEKFKAPDAGSPKWTCEAGQHRSFLSRGDQELIIL